MESPKVFISYSHDSDEHKQWVLQLSTKLIENGVDVMLDQWDIRLGTDQTLFMEKLSAADRVLVICTDIYVKKADNREGGVGYEGRIITAQIAENLKTDKFIPVIRQSSNERKMPIFLGKKQYIDFTNDDRFDKNFNELLHDIHNVPIIPKPPLGENPLAKHVSELKVSSHNLPKIPLKIESAVHAYESAFELARADDTLGWSRLVRQTHSQMVKSLMPWRQEKLDEEQPRTIEQKHQVMDTAINIAAPLISIALVGVESRNENFNNQKYLLGDLLNIQSMKGWNHAGYRSWIEIPYAMGYIYHSLHGSICLQTSQLDLAFSLAKAKFPLEMGSQFTKSVWENSQLMSYCTSLGRNRIEGWKYLVNAYDRWEWLSLIFADDMEYRTSLVAYYMTVSIHELAAKIALGKEIRYSNNAITIVPFDFLLEEYEIKQRATSLLLRDSDLPELWTCFGVTQEEMKDSWETWIDRYEHLFLGPNQNHRDFYAFATSPPQYINFFNNL